MPIKGVDAEWLYHGIKEHGHKEVYLGKDFEDIMIYLRDNIRTGDRVITLGAGDIHRVGDELIQSI